ncbi:hypothetical protein EV363DRAFT_1369662 [Boletus edulis]|nr:hypothetical protein EV363DRAFT_1369662 [Boletus edulis]
MAAYLYESYIEPNTVPGNNSFVAGFVQCKSRLREVLGVIKDILAREGRSPKAY